MPGDKFRCFTERTYGEVTSMKERIRINKEYEQIEEQLEKYSERKVSTEEFAKNLGDVVLCDGEKRPSSQIYAFEQLLKSLSEIDHGNKKDIDVIVEEVIFDVAVSDKNPMKQAYLLGILCYYSSKQKLESIERQLSSSEISEKNIRIKEEADIIGKINGSIFRLKNTGTFSNEMKEVFEYIDNDFPEVNNKCRVARLIANYYSKEAFATRPPELGLTQRYGVTDLDIWKKAEGNGIPRYVYTLSEKYHPSQSKLDEADNFGIKLDVQVARFEGDNKKYVLYDMNPELTRLYNRRIRHYKDTKNFSKAEKLEEAFRERIWRDIQNSNDAEAKRIFADKDKLVIQKRTIRDEPLDEEMKKRLEQNE